MQAIIDATLQATLDGIVKNNQPLQQYRNEMLEFLHKYLSYEALKDELLGLYADAYTQRELEDLLAFYTTPTGQKSIALMPELARKGVELGQRRVQAHLPELLETIKKRSLERTQTNGPMQ